MINSQAIKGTVIISLAAMLALWLGVSIVTNQSETVVQFAGVALLLTCVFLGSRIWLLLILFNALSVPVIRGFGTAELGQALFVGFTSLMILMRRQPLRIQIGELEIWMFLIAASIIQVYLRNPVGLNIFGAGSVGARPYFTVALAFFAAAFLGNIRVKPSEIKWIIKLTTIGTFLGIGLTTLRMSGTGPATFQQGTQIDDGKSSGRIGFLGQIGYGMARLISSYVSPLRVCIHPIWAPLILISVAAAAGSGFRNAVASVGLLYLVAIAYRSGLPGVLFSVFSGSMLLSVLAIVNLISPLPPNIQRALSPFPGTWEKRHVEAASGSTEWRVEMWKEALFTDYWIDNKLLGDGLGLSRRELQLLQAAEEGGHGMGSLGSGMSIQQESMMITGGYHSGPVQCVRITGYIGLILVILAMTRVAVHAHRQIIRCRGTEWYPIALFTGIPAISLPIIYIFVFGDFGRDVSALFFLYAMVRLLEKNLPLPAYQSPKRIPFVLNKVHLDRQNKIGDSSNAT